VLAHPTLRFQFGRLFLPCSILVGGCAAPQAADNAAQRKLLALLMPSRVEIVEPFTGVKSFDGDATPDGIELLLQAVNSLDNPGLMIAGDLRVELFEYVPASADNKGRRLEYWNVELASEAHQRTYWNQVTQMYEFRLEVDTSVIPPARQFLLSVTYNSPLGEHLSDECLVRYRSASAPMGSGGPGPG